MSKREAVKKLAVVAVVALGLVVVTSPSFAQAAGGLQQVGTFLTSIKTALMQWLGPIAFIAGVGVVIGHFFFRFLERDRFVHWIVGLIVLGALAEIVGFFIPGG